MDAPAIKPSATKPSAQDRLLDTALTLIRAQGYAATSVDALCAGAGVTKGAFFHHFASKEALAVAAAKHWSEKTGALFANAPYHRHKDPLDRVLGYVDFRKDLLTGAPQDFSCLVGTLTQEIYQTNPNIREACAASITGHAATLEADIAQAMTQYGITSGFTPPSLALHTQAVLQGAFILAKAQGGAQAARASVDHLRRYIELLFQPKPSKRKAKQ